MSTINLRKVGLLAVAALLLSLSTTIPGAYGKTTLLDAKVIGNGSEPFQSYSCSGLFFFGFTSTTINFTSHGGIGAGHGSWSIKFFSGGVSLVAAAGSINSVSTDKLTYTLMGIETQGCHAPSTPTVTITGACGNPVTISYAAAGESGTFTGSVTCEGANAL